MLIIQNILMRFLIKILTCNTDRHIFPDVTNVTKAWSEFTKMYWCVSEFAMHICSRKVSASEFKIVWHGKWMCPGEFLIARAWLKYAVIQHLMKLTKFTIFGHIAYNKGILIRRQNIYNTYPVGNGKITMQKVTSQRPFCTDTITLT